MKNNIFIDYILRARNTASAAFNTAGDDARGYAADLDKVSHSGFKFGRNQDSVVQPALAMSTSRSESFIGSVLKWGATIFGLKAAFSWLTGQLNNTTNTIGNMQHSFANVPGSIGATVQLSGRSMREVFKYRDVMRQVARDIRNSDVGASVTDWKNALFGLLQAGIRDVRVMKSLAKEAIILGHALHIDPEVVSKSFGRFTLELGFTKEQIHNLSGALSLLRTNGLEVTQQSLSKIDNKMKAFAGAFGPDKIKDIYAASAALGKYGDAQYILDNIMDASMGDRDTWVKLNQQVTQSLGGSAAQAMDTAMIQGDLNKAVGIYIKAIPGLAAALKRAGVGGQDLAESLGLDREKTLALEKAAPRMGIAFSKAMGLMLDQAKIATAAQDVAKEATDNFGSRLVALAADITDRYGHIKDNISTRLGGILPTNFGDRIEGFFNSVEAGINGFLDKNAPELRAWWTDITSGWGKFDSKELTLSLDKFWKEHKFDKDDVMTFLTTLKTLAMAIKDIIVGTMSLMSDLVLLFADDSVTKHITKKTTAMEKLALTVDTLGRGAKNVSMIPTLLGEEGKSMDTVPRLKELMKIRPSDKTPEQKDEFTSLRAIHEGQMSASWGAIQAMASDISKWVSRISIKPSTYLMTAGPSYLMSKLLNEHSKLRTAQHDDAYNGISGMVNDIAKGVSSLHSIPKELSNTLNKSNVDKSVDQAKPLDNIIVEEKVTSVPLVVPNEGPLPNIITEDTRSAKLERGLAGLDAIISKNRQKEVERASEPQPINVINRTNNDGMEKRLDNITRVLEETRDAQPTGVSNIGKEETLRYGN